MKNLITSSLLTASLATTLTSVSQAQSLLPELLQNTPQHQPFATPFFLYYPAPGCCNNDLIHIEIPYRTTTGGGGGTPRPPGTTPPTDPEPEETEEDDDYGPTIYQSGQSLGGGSTTEYGAVNGSGACGTSSGSCCGAAGGAAGGGAGAAGGGGFAGANADNANALPEVHFQRIQRDRYPRRTSGSLGWHNYFKDYDNTLFLHKNNQSVQYLNPSIGDHDIITGFDVARGAWADSDESVFGIFLYDDLGNVIIDPNGRNLAKSAIILKHDGTSEHHDVFFSQSSGTGGSRLTALADRNGNTIDVEYIDALPADHIIPSGVEMAKFHRRTLIRDAYGKETTFTWDRWSGLYIIMSATYPNGQTTTYNWANFGTFNPKALREINYPDGSKTTYSVQDSPATGLSELSVFDASSTGSNRQRKTYQSLRYSIQPDGSSVSQSTNMLRKAVNGRGETTFANQVTTGDTRIVFKGGNRVEKHTFSSRGGLSKTQRINDIQWQTGFHSADSTGWSKQTKSTAGYDSRPSKISHTDTKGRTRHRTRDPLSARILATNYADGSTSGNTRNQFQQSLTGVDRLGRSFLNTYSPTGNLLTRTHAVGTADETTATYLYNIKGQVIEIRDALYDANTPELHNTQFEYDANGYLTKKVSSADIASGTRPEYLFSYDIAGRIATSTDPLGRTATYEYDNRNRTTKITYSDTSTELTEYGTGTLANLVIKHTDRNGIDTEYTYDTAGRLYQTKTATGLPEESITQQIYLYGTSKVEKRLTNGELTTYLYDYANRRIGSTVKANSNTDLTTTREYDEIDRLRSSTDAYGRKTFYLYDQNDRVIRTVTETVPSALTAPAFVAGSSQTVANHTYSLIDKDSNQLDTTGTHLVTYTDPRDLYLQNLTRDLTANAKFLITESIFDSEGQRLITTDARGINSWTEYDNLGRTTLTIAAVGTPSEIRSEQDYDENSNLTESRSPRHFTEGPGTTADLTGVGKDTYTYNGRNMRATHKTAVGSTEEQTQTWTYYLDGRADEHTDFRGNIAKQIWHLCCGRLQASIQRDGTSTTTNNTDYNGNTTHTATVSVNPNGNWHNPADTDTLREITTRYDGRGRPTHTTVWLKELGTVDDDARVSLGDATGIPIAGLDGVLATDGLTTSYEYDDDLTDGLGIDADYATQLTELNARYGYNPFNGGAGVNGYAVKVTNPEDETTVQITDGAGRTILTINPEGDIATMHYDEVVSDADLWSASNTPNQGTLLATKSIDALGNENTTYTDAAGRTIATKDAENNISGAAYNANSSVVSTRDANSLGQDCDYDALNRPTTCADLQETAEGNSRTSTYNAASQVLTSTNADGETTTNVYDVRSRLESTTDPNNITTSYLYDANNNLITLEDGNNNQRHWFFDERNLNTTKVYPGNAGNDFYTQNFDALGRVSIKVDQIGTTCTYNYDLAGRLEEKQYHTGATPAQGGTVTQGGTLESTDTFTYDAASRILTTHKGRHNIATQHTYAPDSQPLTETLAADGRTYTTTRSYDDANRPLTHTYPSGETTHYAYTDRNLVDTVHYEDKIILTNTHDDGYRLTNQAYGNGLEKVISYNRQDNLRNSDITYDGTQTLDDLNLSYQYEADKQISAENIVGDLIQNTSFTANYDDGNRITSWTRAGAPTNNAQTWNYDDAGNWNSTTKDGTTEARNHSAADQITSIAGNAATHDLKGNLTEYEINSKEYQVEYDLDNRIIKVDVDNDDVEYRYDALGRRVIRKEGTTKSALIWWGNSENAEHKHTATQTVIQNDIMSHPTRLNAVIARAVDGSKFKLQWYHKNYLDHVYAVSKDNGDLIEHYRYTAFGEVTCYNSNGIQKNKSLINNQIMWNTRRQDELTGYYLYKYRHYDPALGRWPSRDPIGESGGMNLYAFVGNNGINHWDRLGLVEETVPYDNSSSGLIEIIVRENMEREERRRLNECYDEEFLRDNPIVPCNCGDIRIRKNVGIMGDNGPLLLRGSRNTNPWISIGTDPNSPTQFNGDTVSWNYKIVGGNCYNYKVTITETVHPDDLAVFDAAGTNYWDDYDGFDYSSNELDTGLYNPMFNADPVFGQNFTRNRGRPFMDDNYTSPISGVGQRRTLTVITIKGYHQDSEEEPCTKIFYAQ